MPGSETIYAYLAGVIDIDGRIGIRPALGYRRRSDGRMTYYVATIALSDASPVIPDLLQAVFPARRSQYKAALSLIALIERDAAGPSRPLTSEQEHARHSLYNETVTLNALRPRRIYR
jgi:hypothetical protein